MINTYLGYQLIARDIPKSLERVQSHPMVQRETEYYLENIGKVKSIEDFMADSRLYRYAMKAHGLEDMAYAKALIVKALEGGIDDEDAFANKLTDKRYREFVATFNFARDGEVTTIFDRAQQGTVDKYLRQTLEQDAGADNEGVRLALYFQRNAASIASPFGILADQALAKVVYTALGLPESFRSADIDRQAALIGERLNLEDFKDPALVDEFLKRFTSLWELSNPSSPQASITALFAQPTEAGISTNLLLSLQTMKF